MSLARGHGFEDQALSHLQAQGLKLVARNVRCRHGEIDLVMEHAQQLVFVEVRARKPSRFGGAALSVDAGKQRRLARAAAWYLASHPRLAHRACRFDVLSIDGSELSWIRDAFSVSSDGAL